MQPATEICIFCCINGFSLKNYWCDDSQCQTSHQIRIRACRTITDMWIQQPSENWHFTRRIVPISSKWSPFLRSTAHCSVGKDSFGPGCFLSFQASNKPSHEKKSVASHAARVKKIALVPAALSRVFATVRPTLAHPMNTCWNMNSSLCIVQPAKPAC